MAKNCNCNICISSSLPLSEEREKCKEGKNETLLSGVELRIESYCVGATLSKWEDRQTTTQEAASTKCILASKRWRWRKNYFFNESHWKKILSMKNMIFILINGNLYMCSASFIILSVSLAMTTTAAATARFDWRQRSFNFSN